MFSILQFSLLIAYSHIAFPVLFWITWSYFAMWLHYDFTPACYILYLDYYHTNLFSVKLKSEIYCCFQKLSGNFSAGDIGSWGQQKKKTWIFRKERLSPWSHTYLKNLPSWVDYIWPYLLQVLAGLLKKFEIEDRNDFLISHIYLVLSLWSTFFYPEVKDPAHSTMSAVSPK